jgi:hypothetical protein
VLAAADNAVRGECFASQLSSPICSRACRNVAINETRASTVASTSLLAEAVALNVPVVAVRLLISRSAANDARTGESIAEMGVFGSPTAVAILIIEAY